MIAAVVPLAIGTAFGATLVPTAVLAGLTGLAVLIGAS